MRKGEVQAYLEEHIPLSGSMRVDVLEAGPDGVAIRVPLEPNVNHRSTAFGGSVAALAILAGWTLVHLRLRDEGLVTHTVIQTSSVHYDAPIHGAFRAVTEPVEEPAWERFVRAITKHGKGRLHVSANVFDDGAAGTGGTGTAPAATFTGAYVAIAGRKSAGDA